MKYISASDLEAFLKTNDRVYLCGNLEKKQEMDWISTDGVEIGISHYKHFKADIPHYHMSNIEYNFILSGESKIFLIEEEKEFHFKENTLFVIPPNTKYASKHQKDTKIMFIKVPGGNDKIVIGDIGEQLTNWLSRW